LRLFSFLRKRAPSPPAREIRDFFNDAARDEEHFPSTIDERIFHVKLLLDHLGDLNGATIADLGCGKGRFARIVKQRHPSARVLALDIAEAMLAHVPRDCSAIAASMTALPIRTGSCNAAYATESLEHAIDIPKAVEEMCRIVQPGGRILIIDKNLRAWGRLETPPWEKWFDEKELSGLLRRHCREVRSRPLSYWEDVAPDGLFLAWLAVK
jgi:ubiquinone/menaquinone biosynthesis C-methylase UbiE